MSTTNQIRPTGKIGEAFLWGLLLTLPNMFLIRGPFLIAFTLPFSFGAAFALVNRDLFDPRGKKITLSLLIFPLSYVVTIGMAYLSIFLFMGSDWPLASGYFLVPLLGAVLTFPGFLVTWFVFRDLFETRPTGKGIGVAMIGSSIMGFGALVAFILGMAFNDTLNQAEWLSYFFTVAGFGLVFGGVNAYYRFLINTYGWKDGLKSVGELQVGQA